MRKRALTTVWLLLWISAVGAQELPDSLESPHPWRALGEVVLANGVVNLFDRFVLNEPFSRTSFSSISTNLKSGFTWDNDKFLQNQIGHPCQGTFYHNAARCNGMNFWQSLPYTFGGSLLWEIAGERERPAVNDLVTTTVGGTGLGEVTYRLAGRIIREQERGPRRVVREVSAALINPMNGFHRLVTGRAWKVSTDSRMSAAGESEGDSDGPRLMVGGRYVAAADDVHDARLHSFFAFSINYGQAADGDCHDTPYDFFSGEAALTFGGGQPPVSHLQITGRLCSTPIADNKQVLGELGLYQYLGYEDSRLRDSSQVSPFPYSEMASVGPGLTFVFPRLTSNLSAEQRFFAKGIVLGGSKSDYYYTGERDYNYGSGYGAAMMSRLAWHHVAMLQLDVNYLHLFTWNAHLGDNRSNTRLLSVGLRARAYLSRLLSLQVGASHISRHSYYHQHPSHRASCYELKAALQYAL